MAYERFKAGGKLGKTTFRPSRRLRLSSPGSSSSSDSALCTLHKLGPRSRSELDLALRERRAALLASVGDGLSECSSRSMPGVYGPISAMFDGVHRTSAYILGERSGGTWASSDRRRLGSMHIVSPDGDDVGCTVRGRRPFDPRTPPAAARVVGNAHHRRLRPQGRGDEFHDSTPTASATGVEPGLAASASGRTTTTTASATAAALRRHRRLRPLLDHLHQPTVEHGRAPPPRRHGQEATSCASSASPGSGTAKTCTCPNASTSGGFANGAGSGFRCAGPSTWRTSRRPPQGLR